VELKLNSSSLKKNAICFIKNFFFSAQNSVVFVSMERDMAEKGGQNGRLVLGMRRLMAGAILCCLSGAVLVVVGGKSGSKGRLLEQQVVMAEKQVVGGSTALVGYPADGLDRNVDMGYGPTAEWKAFPIEGLNVGYPKLQSSFESEHFEPQKGLPPIGFNPAGKEGWDGKLPVEPVRENEVNHPLKLDPFERLPALEQANISKATAEAAAKVAKEAYAGGGKEKAKDAAPAPAGETPAATPKSPSQAVVSKGLNQLAGLQRTAAALTSEAKAAVDALNQAERRVAQEHTHETQQQQQAQQQQQQQLLQEPESPAAAAEAGSPESLAHKSDRRDVERAALEDAKREVDEALRRLAAKHQSLRQAPREGEQAPAAAEKNAIQKKIARAQQAIYDRFDREYKAAVGKTHQQLTQRPGDATHRGTQKLWIGVKDPDDEYEQDAEGERNDQGDVPRHESREDVMRYIQKYNKLPEPNPMASNPNYIPTSGPLERATIVRDVPARNWPLVGQIGHTHSWPFLRYDKDLVIQGEDPVVAPASCGDDPISVDCTGITNTLHI
jgi:hypothetical protein